jgi:peptide-methionine (S)-S-oxide reductase
MTTESTPLQQATFGSGCFWCTEAVFLRLDGVVNVVSGYSGGTVPDPEYRAVCSGQTGHAEVVRITYDPGRISFDELLQAFFFSHDPTTLNRQGNDQGTQYRSVIFSHDEAQRLAAENWIARLNQTHAYPQPVVTEVSPLLNFYPAEDYHQDYYALHGREPYCQLVIRPKLEKFQQAFSGQLKASATDSAHRSST